MGSVCVCVRVATLKLPKSLKKMWFKERALITHEGDKKCIQNFSRKT
jgi:hypothetical protein